MEGLAAATALLLGGVFAWAGAAKLANRRRTAAGFAAFGLPAPALLATAVPALELVLAAGFLTVPGVAGPAAVVVLGAFTAFLVRAIRSGTTAGCGCFGTAGADPVSGLDLLRNGILVAAAALASSAPAPPSPGPGAVAVVAAVGLAVAAGLVTARRRARRPRTPLGTPR